MGIQIGKFFFKDEKGIHPISGTLRLTVDEIEGILGILNTTKTNEPSVSRNNIKMILRNHLSWYYLGKATDSQLNTMAQAIGAFAFIPKPEECSYCHGVGTVPTGQMDEMLCPRCRGTRLDPESNESWLITEEVEIDKVREQIAFEHYIDSLVEPMSRDLILIHWQSLTVDEQKPHFSFADQIMSIPEICFTRVPKGKTL